MRAARILSDPAAVRPSKAIAATARAAAYAGGPLVAITGRAYLDLIAELGSDEAAVRYLVKVAGNTGRPLAVNLATGPETSTTVFVAPKSWTDERLRGWAAGHHAELEAAFGPATVRPLEDL